MYAIYDQDGTVEMYINCAPEDINEFLPPGKFYILLPDDAPKVDGSVIDGKIVETIKEEIELTTEQKWMNIRNKRSTLLRGSDWIITRSLETNIPVRQVWLDYRQELRDIPDNFENPDDVIWPIPPA